MAYYTIIIENVAEGNTPEEAAKDFLKTFSDYKSWWITVQDIDGNETEIDLSELIEENNNAEV